MDFDDATDAEWVDILYQQSVKSYYYLNFFCNLIALSSDKSDMCKAHSVGPEKGQAMGQL